MEFANRVKGTKDGKLLIMELGVNDQVPTLQTVATLIQPDYNTMMIRVPYYDPRTFTNADKLEADDRELEKTDPMFQISRHQITRMRIGVPVFLNDLYSPNQPDKYKYQEYDERVLDEMDRIKERMWEEKSKIEEDYLEDKKQREAFDKQVEAEYADKPPVLTVEQAIKAHKVQTRIQLLHQTQQQAKIAELSTKHAKLIRKSMLHSENMKDNYLKKEAKIVQKMKGITFNEALIDVETQLLHKVQKSAMTVQESSKNEQIMQDGEFVDAMSIIYMLKGFSVTQAQDAGLHLSGTPAILNESLSEEIFSDEEKK